MSVPPTSEAPEGRSHNRALEHILKVEADIVQAASHLNADYAFRTEFPPGAFGNAINLGQTPATIEQWLARRGMTSAMAKEPARAVA